MISFREFTAEIRSVQLKNQLKEFLKMTKFGLSKQYENKCLTQRTLDLLIRNEKELTKYKLL